MLDIPQWVISSLKREKVDCHKCGHIFEPQSVKAIGIRESYQVKKKELLFVELLCQKCRNMTIFEIRTMGLVDLSIDVLANKDDKDDKDDKEEGYDSDPYDVHEEFKKEDLMFKLESSQRKKMNKKPARPNLKSKITLKEIKEHSQFLETLKTNDEFLQALGMSPEEIKRYEYKKEKNNE